jgi:hypothetical protein
MKRVLGLLLVLIPTLAFAGFNGDSFGSAGFSQYSAAITGPSSLITPIFSIFQLPNTLATTIQNGAFTGSYSLASQVIFATNTVVRQIPIPLAGTFSGLAANLAAAQSGATIQTRINGTLGNLTCTLAPGCTDTTHSDTINAGDLLQYTFDPHGTGWAQTAPGQASILLTAANGQQAAIISSTTNTAVGSAARFIPISGVAFPQTTALPAGVMFPVSGTITGLYAFPAVADTGTNRHWYTVCVNETLTGACAANPTTASMTCQGDASVKGCCVNTDAIPGYIGGSGSGIACTGTSPVSIAAGDTVSVYVFCLGSLPNTAGSCANVDPAIGIRWVPTTTNQVPLFAEFAAGTNPSYTGLTDYTGVASPPGTRLSWQLAPALTTPATMTFSNMMWCITGAPGAGTARAASLEYGTGITAPSSLAGPTVALNSSSTACPGANSGTFLAGAIDNVNSFATAASGYSFDTALTVTLGSPVSMGTAKASMVVTVP